MLDIQAKLAQEAQKNQEELAAQKAAEEALAKTQAQVTAIVDSFVKSQRSQDYVQEITNELDSAIVNNDHQLAVKSDLVQNSFDDFKLRSYKISFVLDPIKGELPKEIKAALDDSQFDKALSQNLETAVTDAITKQVAGIKPYSVRLTHIEEKNNEMYGWFDLVFAAPDLDQLPLAD